ncbi:MAG: hypothetical protein JSV27_00410 [Candidatus Bathyarchaeota archaeon]|nr:MAG: hypothetical protein JSV27_00410 [Candidatus Bathyarchaeota archaeon]
MKLRLIGQAYFDHRTLPGWKGALPFYAFTCPRHGVVEDYPHGYGQRRDCPMCQREKELLRIFARESPGNLSASYENAGSTSRQAAVR